MKGLRKNKKDCRVKERMPDRQSAKIRVEMLARKGRGKLYYYLCDFCNGFHLTRQAR